VYAIVHLGCQVLSSHIPLPYDVSKEFDLNYFSPISFDILLQIRFLIFSQICHFTSYAFNTLPMFMKTKIKISNTFSIHIILGFADKYSRQMPKTRIFLYWLSGYILISYCVIQICYYAVLCRPFSQYWALPVTNNQCATYSTYSKIQMVFNISSDIGLITLPVAILSRSSLPFKRKMVLCALFSLGLFTIICAILNK
jgi:hypothetical protein